MDLIDVDDFEAELRQEIEDMRYPRCEYESDPGDDSGDAIMSVAASADDDGALPF